MGADIVEVVPAYCSSGSDTAFMATTLVYEVVTSIVLKGLRAGGDADGLKASEAEALVFGCRWHQDGAMNPRICISEKVRRVSFTKRVARRHRHHHVFCHC